MDNRRRAQRRPGPTGCATLCNERGVVLATSLILLAVLSLVGATAIITTITDTRIASNFEHNTRAFYQAEAGIHYTLARLPALIADGSLELNGGLPTETIAPPISAPAGFSFNPISTFTRVGGSSNYQFQSTGRVGTSRVTLDTVFRRDGTSFTYGFFGSQLVQLSPLSAVISYDSSVTPDPTFADSTGEGDIGSNGEATLDFTVNIEGSVALGEDSAGNPGTYTVTPDPSLTPTVSGGWPPAHVGRVEPDPLGAIGGNLAAEIATVSASNDNATGASPPIVGNAIDLGMFQNLTLTAGNYYLQSITLNALSTLEIDTSAGEVAIYLNGPLEAKLGSTINYTAASAVPTDFTLYSNASAAIVFAHYGDIKGAIYAPYATVEVGNQAGVFSRPMAYGLIWAATSILHDNGQFYFDTALKNKFLAGPVSIVSWKETRN